MFRSAIQVFILLCLFGGIVACGQSTSTDGANPDDGLQIVASTTVIGDVVQNIAGDAASVTVIMPLGSDPHAYEPTPQDTVALNDADVIFINGLGLEETLRSVLDTLEGEVTIVPLAEQLETIEAQSDGREHEEERDEADSDHEHTGPDSHVWMNPNNVRSWTDIIEETLSEMDSTNAGTYASNADAYRTRLKDLDAWIREQVATVPEENRELVTDHTAFTYFADEYGFEQIGAVIPGTSTMAEPSAQEMAELQDAIAEHVVPAIFVSETVNPQLSEQVASDTGVEIRRVYTGGLSEANGPASTYIEYMRYNVSTIVDALK